MIALVPRHGTKNPIFGVLAHGLFLSRGENWGTQRKTPWSEEEKQPQTPT